MSATRYSFREKAADRARWGRARRAALLSGVLIAAGGTLPALGQDLAVETAELWFKDSPGVLDNAHPDDQFGTALATCDFDGDGFPDLAVGAPGDKFFGNLLEDSGAVSVLYGGPAGLSASDDQILYQNGNSLPESDDFFGSALAAGHFNDDLYCDLAVGSPGEDLNGDEDVGAFDVFYGSSSGLEDTSTTFYQVGPPTLNNHGSTPEAFDQFGSSFAVGNFNGDAYHDLAVGAPLENWNTTTNSGHVIVYHGSATGLVVHSGWSQARADIQGVEEAGDEFGHSLAAGDFDDDGFDDLAIGVPGQEIDGDVRSGAVSVIVGSATGLTPDADLLYSQDTPGIGPASEPDDEWGRVLAAGNFNGDDYEDLAVGSPLEGLVGASDAGAFGVMYGSVFGPLAASYDSYTQDQIGGGGASEGGDQFGYSLAAGNVDGDEYDDLLIGSPFEDVVAIVNAGAFVIAYGSDQGIQPERADWITQAAISVETSETADYFGMTVAFGDFDRDGHYEAVIAAPGEDVPCTLNCVGTATDAGVVIVMDDGSIFDDGFEAGSTAAWSSTVP
ncbi:MAG: hypothetical protein DWQ36_05810 [Acidobacteria bacterium]|nr:MAG: hypothetical protein DWQ30_08710 [Acidobacteriota bacterium]REK09775.1 MAG: hypothetical protein DWQ36_05810 [Acidobacteriota bacterium]